MTRIPLERIGQDRLGRCGRRWSGLAYMRACFFTQALCVPHDAPEQRLRLLHRARVSAMTAPAYMPMVPNIVPPADD